MEKIFFKIFGILLIMFILRITPYKEEVECVNYTCKISHYYLFNRKIDETVNVRYFEIKSSKGPRSSGSYNINPLNIASYQTYAGAQKDLKLVESGSGKIHRHDYFRLFIILVFVIGFARYCMVP